jgi:hypothetical protein
MFQQKIDIIDEVKINPTDISKTSYEVTENIMENIKWCRKNFGNRGDGWDFIGNNRKVLITIWSSKLKVMYELWKN